MITKNNAIQRKPQKTDTSPPCLQIAKLGIVSRDYNHKYENKYRDFSYALPNILNFLDKEGCDTVIFSLFSIDARKSFNPYPCFEGLKNIKAVLLEEFKDAGGRERSRYIIYYNSRSWQEYDFRQQFGTLSGKKEDDIVDFVDREIPKRIMGNCCVLLCGETNGVKYLRKDRKVCDVFGLRKSIPETVNIILNPIHDYMTRFEMKLKRQFLSNNNRWVVSVWNKGKKGKNGRSRDSKGPAWTVYCNQKEKEIAANPIGKQFNVEVGILQIPKNSHL